MNKREFMDRLSKLLTDVSLDERIEALQYYEDYFADAGEENEATIITELISPESLAKTIKEELAGNDTASAAGGEYTEQGFRNQQYKHMAYPEIKTESTEENNYEQWHDANPNRQNSSYSEKRDKKRMTGTQITFLVIACVFASPIIIGLVSGIFGIVIGVLATVFSIWLGFGIAGVVCMIAGVIACIIGIINLAVLPAAGIMAIGAGVFVFGLGLLFMALSSLCMKGVKVVCKGSLNLVKSLLNRRRVFA